MRSFIKLRNADTLGAIMDLAAFTTKVFLTVCHEPQHKMFSPHHDQESKEQAGF